jgi:PKD repeat protein
LFVGVKVLFYFTLKYVKRNQQLMSSQQMKTLLTSFLVGWSFLFGVVYAGNTQHAGHAHAEGEQCASPVPPAQWEVAFQEQILEMRKNMGELRGGNYTIPVVVHIIHTGQSVGTGANLPSSRITSQIDVLNRDFNGVGTGVQNVPSVFANLVANTGITFCLATKDPQGNNMAEPGVNRIRAQDKGWNVPGLLGYNPTYVDATIKPQSQWDPNLYLNIWVCQLSLGLLGYAVFPNFTTLTGIPVFFQGPETDGVVITTQAFGIGSGTLATYNGGRTTTHEIGHWLGLRHIWGDGDCNFDDFVTDTPLQSASSSGCPTFPRVSCNNSGNMTMNFMDYSNDECAYMFSLGQKDRMITAMERSPLRKALANSPMCQTGALGPFARIEPEVPAICPGQSVTFLDKSLFNPTAWEWSFPGGTPSTSNVKNPVVTYPDGGVYQVTLKASNGAGSNTTTINYTVVPTFNIPYSQNFEGNEEVFPPEGWTVVTRNNFKLGWAPYKGASANGIGDNSIYFDNTNIDATGFEDDIRTPMFDLSTAIEPALIYDFAHAPYIEFNLYDDEFEVLASTNCGQSFTSLFRKKGTEIQTAPPLGEDWAPAANEWRRDTIRLTQYAGQSSVMINIRNIAKYGHSFYVDNVVLRDLSAGAPPEVVSIAADVTSVCPGSTVTFTATTLGAPTSYTWTVPGSLQGTATTGTNTVTVTYDEPGIYPVTVQATNTNGTGTLTRNNFIVVKDRAVINVNSASVCGSSPATLTASGGRSYVWSTGATTPSITVTPSGTTEYFVIGEAANGCKDTAFATVTVSTDEVPVVNVNSVSACVGSTVTLSASGATTYSWSNGGTGASIDVVVTGNSNIVVTGTTAGCSGQATAVVTALPTPAKPSITRNGNVLTSSASSNNQWFKDGVAISGANGQSYTVTEPGAYQVLVIDPSSDCSSISNEFNVTSTAVKNQLKDISVRLYPNPNKGSFNLELESSITGNYVLSISNVAGQELNASVVAIAAGRLTIPVDWSSLPDGMYFVRLAGAEGQVVLPVVIQR